MSSKYLIITVFALLFVISCKQSNNYTSDDATGNPIAISYAKGFTITEFGEYIEIVVRNPLDTTKVVQRYHLYDGDLPAVKSADAIDIKIPINDLASLSTTHIGFLEALGQINKLIAFSGTRYIYSNEVASLVHANAIQEIGNEGGIDMELLVKLQPDIVLTYQTGDESYDHYEKMRSMHLIPVIDNEYLELTPLGQAEWIKFIAAFFNVSDKANKIFDSVALNYNSIKQRALDVERKPTVFTGLAYKGEWTLPGGKSFAANYLSDAGAQYLWYDNKQTGNFPISFEEVINKAQHADYWINAGSATSTAQVVAADPRYTFFDACSKYQIFNNYLRVNENGGNDYWESAIVYPDRVLSDLVRIFHPEINTETNFNYYIQLQ